MSQPTHTLTGIGSSLWPLVQDGALISIVRVDPSAIRRGDIVVYCAKHITVTHRVLSIRLHEGIHWFLTKGDNKLDADGWLPSYRLEGKVVSIRGRSLDTPPLLFFSRLLYWRSLLQWRLYFFLTRSKATKPFVRWFHSHVTIAAIFSRFLTILFGLQHRENS